MKEECEYRFVIDAYNPETLGRETLSPETLPMARLAQYMAGLARLLGQDEQGRFVGLEPGSAVIVQSVEPEAAPEVRDRIRALAHDKAPDDAAEAFKALNRYLADDNAVGSLWEGGGAEVIRFPGREQPAPLTFGPVKQPGVLDGVLIRIGGRNDTVPVHLRDSDRIHKCNATRDMARRLAVHLYGPTLRVRGDGCWERDADGVWSMKRFKITGFDELDDTPLGDVAERLRGVEGGGWKDIDDPAAELRRLRGLDEAH